MPDKSEFGQGLITTKQQSVSIYEPLIGAAQIAKGEVSFPVSLTLSGQGSPALQEFLELCGESHPGMIMKITWEEDTP